MKLNAKILSIFALYVILLTRTTNANVRIAFTNCKSIGWKCINNNPAKIVYSCNVSNKMNISIFIRDFFNGVTSLTIANCNMVILNLDCIFKQEFMSNSSLKTLQISNCSSIEFPSSEARVRQVPSEVKFTNIGYISAIPYKTFKDPVTDIEKRCLGSNTHIQRILLENVTIGTINYKAFFNLNSLKEFKFNNSTIQSFEEKSVNAVVERGSEFIITNSKIRSMNANALTIKCSKAFISNNVIGESFSNSFNIIAVNVKLLQNIFDIVKSEALAITADKIEIINNKFSFLKSGAFINISAKNSLKSFYYNFSFNEIDNVEVGSLYFNTDISENDSNEEIIISSNRFECKCNRLAWLVDFPYMGDAFNKGVRLNDYFLALEHNNTCITSHCILPLDVIKTLLRNKMCLLPLDIKLMCHIYYDRTINNISFVETQPNHEPFIDTNNNISPMIEDIFSNNTEPAPAFYIIKPEYFARNYTNNTQTRSIKNTVINRDTSSDLYQDVMDDYPSDLITYLRSHNFPNDTVNKMLVINRKNSPNSAKTIEELNSTPRPPSRCHDKDSCYKFVQENKKKALDFYKYLYAQLRPINNISHTN